MGHEILLPQKIVCLEKNRGLKFIKGKILNSVTRMKNYDLARLIGSWSEMRWCKTG